MVPNQLAGVVRVRGSASGDDDDDDDGSRHATRLPRVTCGRSERYGSLSSTGEWRGWTLGERGYTRITRVRTCGGIITLRQRAGRDDGLVFRKCFFFGSACCLPSPAQCLLEAFAGN